MPPPRSMRRRGALADARLDAYRLKLRQQKRMGLQRRLGLLKGKGPDAALDDVEKKMLDHELAIARDLQANLLPKQLPEIRGFEIAAYYRSSREVGGDYYDFMPIDDEHIGIAVADVSGKGIPGSIVVSETRVLMRSHSTGQRSPAAVMRRVNRFLHADIIRGMFVTLFYLVLNVKNRQILMASGGHNPMIYYRASNQSCYLLNPGGLALGIDRGPLFDRIIKEQRLTMSVGDRFVLYTDGVIDTFDPERVAYGLDRFTTLVRTNGDLSSQDIVKKLLGDLETYQAGAPQHDDITIVTLRAVGATSPHETSFENLL